MTFFQQHLGEEGEDILSLLDLKEDEDAVCLDNAVQYMANFRLKQQNEYYERNKKSEETFNSFNDGLKICKFCMSCGEKSSETRLYRGIDDRELTKKLLRQRYLDLVKCVDICRAAEIFEELTKQQTSNPREI